MSQSKIKVADIVTGVPQAGNINPVGNKYNVFLNYNASGSFLQTTGGITSGQPTLVVASNSTFAIGQGIFILGAGGTQRSVANGVTNSTTTITSSTIAFKSDDVGKLITGTNIPAGAYIASVTNATTAVLSASATGSGSSITFTLMKNLVAVISNIVGTTITLDRNASNTVASVRVQHDDTFAINAALADAFNLRGGQVLLPLTNCDGYYRCNAPFDATSNGILTIPSVNVYSDPTHVNLIGEISGFGAADGGLDSLGRPGGVCIDATDAPVASGTMPSVFAGSPFVLLTNANVGAIGLTSWWNVWPDIDHITFIVAQNPTISGVQCGNCLKFSIGQENDCAVISKASPSIPTTSTSYGVFAPQRLNNVGIYIGGVVVGGFYNDMFVGEHAVLNKPYLGGAVNGLIVSGIANPVVGTVCIEGVINPIVADPNNPQCSVRLTVHSEYTANGSWNDMGSYFVTDPNNNMEGIIEHSINNVTAQVFVGMTTNGAGKVRFEGISVSTSKIQRVKISGSSTSSVTFAIPVGYDNIKLTVNARSSAASGSQDLKMQYNGDTTSGHYAFMVLYGDVADGTTAKFTDVPSSAYIRAGSVISNDAGNANITCSIIQTIVAYNQSTFNKNNMGSSPTFYPSGSFDEFDHLGGLWLSTAPITSITLSIATDHFLAGSTFRLEME